MSHQHIRWDKAFRLPQTYWLIVGTALGYGAMLVFTGFRPMGWLVGGLITIGMLLAWFWQFRQEPVSTAGNLLVPAEFQARLAAIATQFPQATTSTDWQQAKQWAEASHAAASQIAERDSLLIPDLLETLYTVTALAQQVVGASQALKQVQTPTYQQLTQEHLQTSRDRLRETHDQLQQLRDQVVLSQLTTEAATSTADLPNRLQWLIDTNKTALQQPPNIPPESNS